jgi:hypothetical protein
LAVIEAKARDKNVSVQTIERDAMGLENGSGNSALWIDDGEKYAVLVQPGDVVGITPASTLAKPPFCPENRATSVWPAPAWPFCAKTKL